MSITNLSLFTPESEIDPAVTRDDEMKAAFEAHVNATNPHSIQTTTNGGILSTTGAAQPLSNPSSSSRIGWGISDGIPFLFLINQFAPALSKILDILLDKAGTFFLRRLDDNYSPVTAKNLLQIDVDGNIGLRGNLEVNGFIKFSGGSRLKELTVEGLTNSAQDTYTLFPLQLNPSKIISVEAVVYSGNLAVPPNLPIAGCTFYIYYHTGLVIYLPPNSSINILNKKFVATIYYVE
jgi:hypothetical protein